MVYTAAESEECCNCRHPLSDGGAYYWGRQRLCQMCYRDEVDWQHSEAVDKGMFLKVAGWSMICLAGVILLGLFVAERVK